MESCSARRRLRAKQQLYIQTELERWPAPCVLEGKLCNTKAELVERLNWMYGRAVYESHPSIYSAPCPAEWWEPYAAWMKHLDLDETKVPWQEAAVHANVKRLGRALFDGVDTFGIY